ncbi:MAG: hypothetical protein HYV65_01015 [Candidatus Spechtbacteria bacterium]|nr:hypothetical protein [Candidatus Spechtbacteria bacterium]
MLASLANLYNRIKGYISSRLTKEEVKAHFLQTRLFAARVFLSLLFSPTESFNFFTQQNRVEVVTESFYAHKEFQEKARLFSTSTLAVIVSSVVIISLFLNLIISPVLVGRAATFTNTWTSYNDFNYKSGGTGTVSTQSNVVIADSGNATNASLGTVKLPFSSTVVENGDDAAQWSGTNITVSQETTDKQEGTGSVKMVQAVAEVIDGGDGSDGAIDLANGGSAGGCTGTGLAWTVETSTCTINLNTKNTFNFTTVDIPVGTSLTINGPYTTVPSAIATLNATGNVTIAGTVNLGGKGYRGGQTHYSAGYGPCGGNVGNYSNGGGGGGFGGTGGTGISSITGGNNNCTNDHGNGGGDGYSNGGNGGGGITINSATTITVSGVINANGNIGVDISSSGKSSGGGALAA